MRGMPVKRLVTLIATAALANGLLGITPSPADAGPEYNLFHFNVCGNRCEDGDATFDQDTDPVKAIYNSLTENQSERAASFVELCKNQFDRLMDELPAEWEGRFVATAWAHSPPAGEEEYISDLCHPVGGTEHNFGNAILVRDAPIVAGSREVRRLGDPQSSNEHRAIICVTADLANSADARFCSTHLWSEAPFSQLSEVADLVDGFTRAVVLMGDFNVEPGHDALDDIYSDFLFDGASTGKFEEADQETTCCKNTSQPCRSGADTAGTRKVDYIFFSRVNFNHISGFPTDPVTESDHEILRARVEAL
jgi:endonuclease/exonuclease/phosphatase family metal-dependent hydrolase